MESDSKNISTSTTAAHSKSRVKLIVVVSIIAVSVMVSALLASAFISAPPASQDVWLFKGAYAKYNGSLASEDMGIDISELSMSFDFNVDFAIQLEVLDFNNTHALVTTLFRMNSSVGGMGVKTEEVESTTWVPLSEMGFMTEFKDANLETSYESMVDIDGFGTRTCMVYEYAILDEGMTMIVYVDKNIGWPLKMTISITGDYSINLNLDIKLVETNIPLLK